VSLSYIHIHLSYILMHDNIINHSIRQVSIVKCKCSVSKQCNVERECGHRVCCSC